MKAYQFLLILSIIAFSTIKSQTTIPLSAYMAGGTLGDMITIYEVNGITVDIGTFGETSWDFSNVLGSEEIPVQFVDASETIFADYFEEAEVALHLLMTQYELDIFGFVKTLEDRVLYFGEAVSDRTGRTVISLEPARELIFPIEYGTSWTYEGVESFIDAGKDGNPITIHTSVDSYGQLTLPNGKTADGLLLRNYHIQEYGFGPDTTKVFVILTDEADVALMFIGSGTPDTGEIQVGTLMWFANDVSSFEDDHLKINKYNLAQNFPNPFNPVTTIEYAIPKSGNVKLIVYDLLGNKVTTLVDENKGAGLYKTNFDATNLGSGIYFAQLVSGGFAKTIKMTLLK